MLRRGWALIYRYSGAEAMDAWLVRWRVRRDRAANAGVAALLDTAGLREQADRLRSI